MANFGTKALNSALNLDCLEMPFQPRWGLAWQYFPIVCSWSWPEIHCAPRDRPSWWCVDWTRSKWTTQLCTRSQKMCLCLAPTEFLAFPQKLQAAHYKEDSGINKRELDPEVISVLQQLLLHHSSATRWHASIHPVLQKLLTFWSYFGSAYCRDVSFASLAEAVCASHRAQLWCGSTTTATSGESWSSCKSVTTTGLLRRTVLNLSPQQTCDIFHSVCVCVCVWTASHIHQSSHSKANPYGSWRPFSERDCFSLSTQQHNWDVNRKTPGLGRCHPEVPWGAYTSLCGKKCIPWHEHDLWIIRLKFSADNPHGK